MYLAISLTETRPTNTRTLPSILMTILKIFGCLNCSFINAVATLICASKTLFLFHVGTMLPPFCVCFASVLRQVCQHGRSRFITVSAYHIPVAPEAEYSPYHATCMAMINRRPASFERSPADSTTVILTLKH